MLVFLTFFLFFLIIPTSLWYELSQEKINQLNQIKEYLNTDIENHDIEFYQLFHDVMDNGVIGHAMYQFQKLRNSEYLKNNIKR